MSWPAVSRHPFLQAERPVLTRTWHSIRRRVNAVGLSTLRWAPSFPWLWPQPRAPSSPCTYAGGQCASCTRDGLIIRQFPHWPRRRLTTSAVSAMWGLRGRRIGEVCRAQTSQGDGDGGSLAGGRARECLRSWRVQESRGGKHVLIDGHGGPVCGRGAKPHGAAPNPKRRRAGYESTSRHNVWGSCLELHQHCPGSR